MRHLGSAKHIGDDETCQILGRLHEGNWVIGEALDNLKSDAEWSDIIAATDADLGDTDPVKGASCKRLLSVLADVANEQWPIIREFTRMSPEQRNALPK